MRPLLAAILLLLADFVAADVSAADAGGFTIDTEVVIAAPRQVVWRAAIDEIGQWWHSDHTISGNAANMRIAAEPLGCFCEVLPGGGAVVHLTVTFVNPGVLLRMTGGLGPLGLMGVNGNMTWEFADVESGTRVRLAYAVGGYHPDGLAAMAGPVDAVLGEAMTRLAQYVANGDADSRDAD